MRAEHLDYLDGWRGLAITFLLVGHFFPVPGINFGAVGVGLFFVLSGLFMSRLLFIQEVPLDVFYRRRLARILPVTFVFLTVVVALSMAFSAPVNWRETLAATLFLNNYFPAEAGKAVMPFGHIWSLSVEEHSYVLLALLALAVRRKKIRAATATVLAALTCVIAILCHALREAPDPQIWLRTEVAGYGIFLSAFLALFLHDRKVPQLPWMTYPVLVIAGIAVHWWTVPVPVRIVVGLGAFAVAVNLLGSAPQVVKFILSLGILRQLGVLSFSLYLWQQPFYLFMHRDGMHPALALGLGVLSGIASYYLIERPVREYLNKHWRSKGTGRSTSDGYEVRAGQNV